MSLRANVSLHAIERKLDRIENKLKRVKRYYAKEIGKFRRHGDRLRSIHGKEDRLYAEKKRIEALLADIGRGKGPGKQTSEVVSGGCAGGDAENAEPKRTDGED